MNININSTPPAAGRSASARGTSSGGRPPAACPFLFVTFVTFRYSRSRVSPHVVGKSSALKTAQQLIQPAAACPFCLLCVILLIGSMCVISASLVCVYCFIVYCLIVVCSRPPAACPSRSSSDVSMARVAATITMCQ